MEIQANGDEDDFEGFKTRNPELYIYEVDESHNLLDGNYATYVIEELTQEEIDYNFDCVGFLEAQNEDECERGPDGILEDDITTDDNESADNGTWILDMPGSEYSSDLTEIYVPNYIIEPLPIMFSDETGAENNYTQWFSGIQVRFDNYWFELPQTNSYAGIDDISYMNIDGTVNILDIVQIVNLILDN